MLKKNPRARCEHDYVPVIEVGIDFDAETGEEAAASMQFTKAKRKACVKCGATEPRAKTRDGGMV